jgi:hypothetical protein
MGVEMLKRSSFVMLSALILIWASDLCAQQNPEVIGTTSGALQSIGSTGDRIAVDDNGGAHFSWMKYLSYPFQRQVCYNYVDVEGNWLGECYISQVNGAGFPQLHIVQGDLAGITYHSTSNPNIENYVVYAQDQFAGFGIFQYYDPPDLIRYRCYWPKIAIDQEEFIHIIATENPPNAGDPMILGHCYSTNGGYVWSQFKAIDTLTTISAIMVSSPVSNKVSVAYSHPTDLNWQIKNDIYFKQLKFDDNYIDYRSQPVNVTGYGQNGDSLFAFDELDAIYDFNDNLHIIWSAFWVSEQGINPTMFLYHYDFDSGTITEMNRITWPPDSLCMIPEYNYPICNMSMSVIDIYPQALIATYTMFNHNDCSAAGHANGDVYFQGSENGGQNWVGPINITNTHSYHCNPGDCHSEVWPSSADRITDGELLHITYVDDRSGGDSMMTNLVYYYLYDLWPVGIINEWNEKPHAFCLLRAWPNPFNATTTIEFTLGAPGDVELIVYDITGAKVETIRKPGLEAGRHSVVWDAKEAASGVYFARLEAGGRSQTVKMLLLR